MNTKQKTLLKISAVLLLLIGLFPPWKEVMHTQELRSERFYGHSLIFEPPKDGRWPALQSYQIDFGSLAVMWVTVGLLTSLGVVYLRLPGGHLLPLRAQAHVDYIRLATLISRRDRFHGEGERDRLFVEAADAKARLAVYASDGVVAAAAAFEKSGGDLGIADAVNPFLELCARMRQDTIMQSEQVNGNDLFLVLFGRGS